MGLSYPLQVKVTINHYPYPPSSVQTQTVNVNGACKALFLLEFGAYLINNDKGMKSQHVASSFTHARPRVMFLSLFAVDNPQIMITIKIHR